MVLLMLVAVVGAIAVTWVLNRTFLEDYYLYNKMNMLDKVFQSVHEVIVQAENNLQTEAESMEDASEGIILDEFGNSKSEKKERVMLQLSDMQRLELDVQAMQNDVSILVAQNTRAIFYSTNSSPDNMFYMLDRVMPGFYPGHKAEYNSYNKIKNVDNLYDLYESYDIRTKTNFLELVWNDEDRDMYVLIRTSMQSIQANVDIANKFLAYAGILVAIIVSIVELSNFSLFI